MPFTATPARIRRVIREHEFARVTDSAVLTQRPAAQDGFSQVRESFFDVVADAQILLDETAVLLKANRGRELVECDQLLRIGNTLPLTPALPRARVIDRTNDVDKTMIVRAIALDMGTDRNSIELIG